MYKINVCVYTNPVFSRLLGAVDGDSNFFAEKKCSNPNLKLDPIDKTEG